MGRTASKTTPVIISKTLYTDDDLNGARIDSEAWKAWISRHLTFNFEGMSVRAEKRRQGYSWYAFKKVAGQPKKVVKAYVGRDEAITLAKLEQAAKTLADHAARS